MSEVKECDYDNCYNPISEESKELPDKDVKLCDYHEEKFSDLLPEDPNDVNTIQLMSFMLNTNLANRK